MFAIRRRLSIELSRPLRYGQYPPSAAEAMMTRGSIFPLLAGAFRYGGTRPLHPALGRALHLIDDEIASPSNRPDNFFCSMISEPSNTLISFLIAARPELSCLSL